MYPSRLRDAQQLRLGTTFAHNPRRCAFVNLTMHGRKSNAGQSRRAQEELKLEKRPCISNMLTWSFRRSLSSETCFTRSCSKHHDRQKRHRAARRGTARTLRGVPIVCTMCRRMLDRHRYTTPRCDHRKNQYTKSESKTESALRMCRPAVGRHCAELSVCLCRMELPQRQARAKVRLT